MTASENQVARLELKIGTRTVTLETGRIARQANAAVLVREADNVVLVTVVGAKEPRPGADFFPLTVEYREHTAAAGRIPGNRQRREGRISDNEVLTCRLIDRSLRPLFPDGYKAEVQVQASVFSAGPGGDPASLALLGACAALHLSDIPFDGPVIGTRSVLYRGRTVLLPVQAEVDEATADLIVSVGPNGIVMAEGEADELELDSFLDHLLATIDGLDKPRAQLAAWRDSAGKPKREWQPETTPEEWFEELTASVGAELVEALAIGGKAERHATLDAVHERYLESLGQDSDERHAAVPALFRKLVKQKMRRRVVDDGLRLDGRGREDVRPITGETGLLPRAHGSALFTRGETQALVTCTLGSEGDQQTVDTLAGPTKERFLLHYNFPPYSVGETRPLRGPGRREIGHGNLACRAVRSLVPAFERFPYTLRIESEITESNGSSSMATVCGACLALMDAGVPIERPVAGVAMGLIAEAEKVAILTDILGDEDHLGDMDFKVTGTSEGITALQLDNKIGGLTSEVLTDALHQARRAIDHVLGRMAEVLERPRDQISDHAPRVHTLRIQPHFISALIGPKGTTIRGIQEETGANVSVDDTGLVCIYAKEGPPAQKALDAVRQIAGEVQVGTTYQATVSDAKDFGVFVRIYDSAEGLVHISKLGTRRPRQGETLDVRVLGVDRRGKIELELA